jgi:hypothetical protein
VPHCFITPQHILEKPGKKDHQIFDASRKYAWDSTPINGMTSTSYGSELNCKLLGARHNPGPCLQPKTVISQ